MIAQQWLSLLFNCNSVNSACTVVSVKILRSVSLSRNNRQQFILQCYMYNCRWKSKRSLYLCYAHLFLILVCLDNTSYWLFPDAYATPYKLQTAAGWKGCVVWERIRHRIRHRIGWELVETEWVALVDDPIKIEHRLVQCCTKKSATSDWIYSRSYWRISTTDDAGIRGTITRYLTFMEKSTLE